MALRSEMLLSMGLRSEVCSSKATAWCSGMGAWMMLLPAGMQKLAAVEFARDLCRRGCKKDTAKCRREEEEIGLHSEVMVLDPPRIQKQVAGELVRD